jgi:hypothetical protein
MTKYELDRDHLDALDEIDVDNLQALAILRLSYVLEDCAAALFKIASNIEGVESVLGGKVADSVDGVSVSLDGISNALEGGMTIDS